MVDKAIYIPIDNISTEKKDDMQVINIRKGTSVYRRKGGGFAKVGRTTKTGVKVSPVVYQSELLKQSFATEEAKLKAEQEYRDKILEEKLKQAGIRATQTQQALREKELPITDQRQSRITTKMRIDKFRRDWLPDKFSVYPDVLLDKPVRRIAEKVGIDTQKSIFFRPLTTEDISKAKDLIYDEPVGTYVKSEPSGQATGYFVRPPKVEITPKQVLQASREFYLWTIFSPLMSTGTAATYTDSKYVYDYQKGKYVLKKDLEKKAEKLLKSFDDAYKKGGQKEVLNNLKKVTKGKDTKGIENLLENLRRKNYIQGYRVDVDSGKFIIDGVRPATSQTSSSTITIQIPRMTQIPAVRETGAILSTGDNLFLTPSKYAATGQYEKTEGMSYFRQEPESSIKTKIDVLSVSPTAQLKTHQRQGVIQKQIQKQGVIQAPIQTTIQAPIQTGKAIQTTIQAPIQKQKSDLLQKQINLLKSRSKIPRAKIPKPKTRLFLKPKLDSALKQVKRRMATDENFLVFGKRFGKDIKIGMFKNQKTAEKKLKGFLKGTLGRSGFISKSGEKLEFSDYKMLAKNKEFRPAKKDFFRVVQKKEFSLGTSKEKREIQFFKKKSKKPKKSKKFKIL